MSNCPWPDCNHAASNREAPTDQTEIVQGSAIPEHSVPLAPIDGIVLEHLLHEAGLLSGGHSRERDGLNEALIDPARRYLARD